MTLDYKLKITRLLLHIFNYPPSTNIVGNSLKTNLLIPWNIFNADRQAQDQWISVLCFKLTALLIKSMQQHNKLKIWWKKTTLHIMYMRLSKYWNKYSRLTGASAKHNLSLCLVDQDPHIIFLRPWLWITWFQIDVIFVGIVSRFDIMYMPIQVTKLFRIPATWFQVQLYFIMFNNWNIR